MISESVNTGLDYDLDLPAEKVTIQRAEIEQQSTGDISFINLGAIDTQQMASVVGFYDAVCNQLNYS